MNRQPMAVYFDGKLLGHDLYWSGVHKLLDTAFQAVTDDEEHSWRVLRTPLSREVIAAGFQHRDIWQATCEDPISLKLYGEMTR